MAFNIFSNGTVADANEVNSNFDYLTTRSITNGINGSQTDDLRFVFNQIAADQATTKTNWSYGGGSYENTGSANAILTFENQLNGYQVAYFGSNNISKTCVYFDFDDVKELNSTTGSNLSFEDGSGSELTGWSLGSGCASSYDAGSLYLLQSSTPAGVTAGGSAFRVFFSGVNLANANTSFGSAQQTIGIDNVSMIAADYYINIISQSAGSVGCTATLTCGTKSINETLTDSTGATKTGSLLIDVSNLTGSQTLKVTAAQELFSGTPTSSVEIFFDNIRLYNMTGSVSTLTRTLSATANGSNWETIYNGSWHTFTNTGSVFGVKVDETRTDGNYAKKQRIKSWGAYITE